MTLACGCWRVAERTGRRGHVVEAICALIDQAANALSHTGHVEANTLHAVRQSADARIAALRDAHGSALRALLRALVERIDLSEDGIGVTIRLGVIDPALEASPCTRDHPAQHRALGQAGEAHSSTIPRYNDRASRSRTGAPCRPGAKPAGAHRDHQRGELRTACRGGLGFSREYASALLRIAYLAPDILTAILEGRQPRGFTRTQLMKVKNIPLDWPGQRARLGFA